MKVGKAKYGNGNFVKRKYFKLKNGDSTFRILPPLGDLSDKGVWSKFYAIHYGYRNSKDQLRPFVSPLVENRKTKMIEVPDAALERIQKLKAELEKAKQSGNQEVAERLTKLVSGNKPMFNLDKNHYVNAIDDQGNIGVLKLRSRAKAALMAAIDRLDKQGVDPLGVDSGRFFVFSRSGMGLETTFQVSVLTKEFEVPGVGKVRQDVVHKLTEDVLNRLSSEAAQLDKLFKRPTAEEVARIVKEGAKAVDEILDAKNNNDEVEEVYEDEDDVQEAAPAPKAQTQPAQQSAAPVAPAAQVAVMQVQTPVTPPSAPTQSTTAQNIAAMSEADFLKQFGI